MTDQELEQFISIKLGKLVPVVTTFSSDVTEGGSYQLIRLGEKTAKLPIIDNRTVMTTTSSFR
jgi:hypothetical protein